MMREAVIFLLKMYIQQMINPVLKITDRRILPEKDYQLYLEQKEWVEKKIEELRKGK